MSGLRAWQEKALVDYFSMPRADYTVTATPGAGKTTFALQVASRLLASRDITRLVVVAPTDHLRVQWAEAAAAAGIRLHGRLGNDARVPAGAAGYATTYAQVASHPLLHQRRCESPNRTLVVLDEVHHAGDGLSWGDAVSEAFGPAARRLSLTGTPFRTSTKERIPFVSYQPDGDGALRSVADFSYSYAEALADGVVRPVVFAAYSGVTRWRDSAGEVLAADLAEPASRRQEELAWRAVLDPRGSWVRSVIARAAANVVEQRASGIGDAACLILASDQEQARAYARAVKEVTGHTPVLVLSDDAAASRKIASFDSGTGMFLVAVRMVSEGVDVRRLTTLVWLTSYRTPLFFAQAVGRVVRSRSPRETATVFLPAVRPLLALAAQVELERDHVLAAPPAAGDGELDGFDDLPGIDAPARGNTVDVIDSEARFAHAVVGGKAIVASEGEDLSTEDEEFLGLPGLLAPEQAAMLLAQREAHARSRPAPASPAAPRRHATADPQTVRADIVSLVNRWARQESMSIPRAHALVRNAVAGPKNSDAPVEVLVGRRDWLLARVR